MTVENLIKSVLGEEAEAFEYDVAGETRKGWRLYLLEERHRGINSASQLVEKSWRRLHDQGIHLLVGPSVFRIGPGQYADSWGAVEFDPAVGPPPIPSPGDFPPTCAPIFALPNATVDDIVEFCKVGSHNAQQLPLDDLMNFMESRKESLTAEERAMVTPQHAEMMQFMQNNQGAVRHGFSLQPHGPEPWRMVQNALAKVKAIAPFAIQFADEAGLHATLLKPVRQQAEEIGKLILQVNPEAMELPISDLEALGLAVLINPNNAEMPDYEAAMTEYIMSVGKFRMWWD